MWRGRHGDDERVEVTTCPSPGAEKNQTHEIWKIKDEEEIEGRDLLKEEGME